MSILTRIIKSFGLIGALLLIDAAWAADSAGPSERTPKANGRSSIGVLCDTAPGGTCRINKIIKDGPADHAGLHFGDVLLRVENSTADVAANVVEQIARLKPGDQVTLVFQRGAASQHAQMTLADQFELSLRMATAGDPAAEAVLGGIYSDGAGVPKNPAESLIWYRKAADQGEPQSQWAVGWYYENGVGVAKDLNTAAQWYRKAADQGVPAAEAHLGSMYFDGIGVAKSDALALKYFRAGAAKDQAEAEFGLGVMYAFGRGVAKDDVTALGWYRKAAAQNDPAAEYFIGMMYESGSGVPKDVKAAVGWYEKSAQHGYPDAQTKLRQLQ
ncbi:MAG TPA: PDZ domain-containing protein [Micropepsaceae bacterium]|nr:PDZ domain-containing protein [Micropepsaceae bacterium]